MNLLLFLLVYIPLLNLAGFLVCGINKRKAACVYRKTLVGECMLNERIDR